ncbi:hypothetical protein BO82DRAFT_358291 [Aspergillus uvarum CBS 121591]|uniref:Uncharacterized protein n=1 Tax=Aspergillus uvarum CBS 121591 TaxID=1448315 RepID=A0A319BX78_9EURO|nr:hypothetical protein BO82DRAFT_358291 [Aspergillus uvarum CBS 121591]PYH77324.1 hypothetical protein BO82DRAFT_358291 [Aspergillus uvarum CBS 121591]
MANSTNHTEPVLEAEDPSRSAQQQTSNITPRVPVSTDASIGQQSHIPALQDQSSAMQTTYLFVDKNLSPRARRSHVMRQHNQKRYLQRMTTQPYNHNHSARPPVPTPTSPRADDSWSPPSPATILDSSRKDPFDSLPAVTSVADQELADAWVSKLSYWSGQNQYIKRQIYKAAIAHPVCFQAVILAYCARWRARLNGLESSPEAEHHLIRASAMIQKAREEQSDDFLAMALAGMSLHENRFGDNESAAIEYEDQALGLLRMGPWQDSMSIAEVFLHYVQYLKMPREFSLGHSDRLMLVHFLRGAKELKLKHSTAAYLTSVPQRRTAFQMASPLFCSLCPGPWPSTVPQDLHKYVVNLNIPSHEVSRTACLIHITSALWDFQYEPDKTRLFLAHLNELVAQYKLDRNPACETFVWLLLEERCSPRLRDSERAWRMGELLKMIKKLPPDLRVEYGNILFSFLMLESPALEVGEFERRLLAL